MRAFLCATDGISCRTYVHSFRLAISHRSIGREFGSNVPIASC